MATKSSNAEHITFSQALKNTHDICDENPELFEHARLALQEWDNGKYTLVGAIVSAMRKAHKAGLGGKTLPRLSTEEIKDLSIIRDQSHYGARAAQIGESRRTPITPPPAPPISATRVGRSPPKAAVVAPKRFSRSR